MPKQFRELGGTPMLLHALRPFLAHPDVAHTVIVLPRDLAAKPPGWLAAHLGGTLTVVPGGEERSDSVAQGLVALPAALGIVLVHDAARPLVDRSLIDRVLAAARVGEGAVPALPLRDTLKEARPAASAEEHDLRVARTLPRDRLWGAQTPQGFPRAVLEEALARARREGLQVTDDAMAVELLGVPVRLVAGSARNFKVTTEEDLHLAERLL